MLIFTFHYVSIKSCTMLYQRLIGWKFTFHYVSIKSIDFILSMTCPIAFTFHYVSIKSIYLVNPHAGYLHLHSTMYLLNLSFHSDSRARHSFTFHYVSIKSKKFELFMCCLGKFTFHYVSIKSKSYSFVFTSPMIYIPLCIY